MRFNYFLFVFFLFTSSFLKATDCSDSDTSIKTSVVKPIACPKKDAVDTLIWEAINVGAPTYNTGNHIACYRIYEGASYKILYNYSYECPRITEILKTALQKSYENYSDTDKAWIMRMAFDEILGVPTKTK